jgi:effector-binding domain-containing protein
VIARYFELWHEDGDVDYEVAVPVLPDHDGSVPDRIGEAHGDLIPAHHAFATAHHGPYDGLQAAFATLARELETLGYVAAGPATAVYIRGREDTADPSDYVTVLRQPYAR